MAFEQEFAVTSQQVSDYQKNGHTILRGIMSNEELHTYRSAIGEAVRQFAKNSLPLDQRDTYGKAFLQVMNLWTQDEKIREFTFAKRFAKIAADLMGVDGVRIYHDQALFKEPGGGKTPWHQDQVYWPIDSTHTITMWMPLVDILVEVGSMTFASGSQHEGYISKNVISDESHQTLASYITAKHIPTVNYGGMQAGDATFHAGWTLHSAPDNPTSHIREVMTIIYVADGAKVSEPDSNARKSDLQTWMPGLQSGDVINSSLNPLVYKRS